MAPITNFMELLKPMEYFKKIVDQKFKKLINKSNYYIDMFLECLVLTNYLCLIVCLKLVVYYLLKYDIGAAFIETLEISEPETWEYIWTGLLIILQCVGALALIFYSTSLLKLYCIGIYCSIGPLIWPYLLYYDDVVLLLTDLLQPTPSWFWGELSEIARSLPFMEFYRPREVQLWHGFPLGMLMYQFLLTAITLHLISGYYCLKLIDVFVEYNYLMKIEHGYN